MKTDNVWPLVIVEFKFYSKWNGKAIGKFWAGERYDLIEIFQNLSGWLEAGKSGGKERTTWLLLH